MTIFDDIAKLAAGMVIAQEKVDRETALSRLAVCRKCTFLENSETPSNWKCGACGCYLEIKAYCYTNRTRRRPDGEITHCPRGFWGDKETANYYRALDGLEPLK